jgi:F0F1-type ATP synthase membrane subunit b/b'
MADGYNDVRSPLPRNLSELAGRQAEILKQLDDTTARLQAALKHLDVVSAQLAILRRELQSTVAFATQQGLPLELDQMHASTTRLEASAPRRQRVQPSGEV